MPGMRRREFITPARRRGGGMAAGGEGAAARADAAHRRAPARSRGRSELSGLGRGVPAGAAAIRLDIGRNVRIDTRWATTNADRHSQTRGGIGRARAGRHPGPWRLDRGAVAAGDPHRADRLPDRRRSGRPPASSTAWRDRAATPPVFSCSNTAWPGNGWSCSSRSRRA